MKMNIILLNLMFLILINSCNSPLSNSEVTDPNLIRPIIKIEKNYDWLGDRRDYIRVQLKDKDNLDIELSGGSVFFNGKKLRFSNFLFGDAVYELKSFKCDLIHADSICEVVIKLADGKEYYNEILTPEIDIKQLDVPSRHNKNESLTISWKDISSSFPQKIKYEYMYDAGDYSELKKLYLNITNPGLGWFKIDKSYFNLKEYIWKVELTVISETTGSTDPELSKEGSIKCKFITYKEIQID